MKGMEIDGQCHCGRVTYRAEIDPAKISICHCTDCQNLTGSAYRVSVPAIEGSFHLTSGKPAVYVKLGESGSRRAQAFCSNCGSPLYTYDSDNPKVYGLRVGCIAERAELVPKKQKWCRSALRWTENLSGIERRETE